MNTSRFALVLFALLGALLQSCSVDNEELEKHEQALATENANILAYVTQKGYTEKPDAYGLYVIIEDSGTGTKLKNEDFIMLSYDMYVLQGTSEKLIETTDSVLADAAGITIPMVYGANKFKVGSGPILGVNGGLIDRAEGARGRLIIPSTLAFKSFGIDSRILPYSTLVFDFTVTDYIPDPAAFDNAQFQEFLTANEINETHRLADGVYRKVHVAGTGDLPELNKDKLVLGYTVKLIDGRVTFRTETDEPATMFYSSNVFIPGFQKAAAEFRKGEESTLVLSNEQAYKNIGNAELLVPPLTSIVIEIKVVNILRPGVIKEGIQSSPLLLKPSSESASGVLLPIIRF